MLCSISNPFAWLFFTNFGRFLVVDDYPVPAANLKYINQKVASAESEWAGQLRYKLPAPSPFTFMSSCLHHMHHHMAALQICAVCCVQHNFFPTCMCQSVKGHMLGYRHLRSRTTSEQSSRYNYRRHLISSAFYCSATCSTSAWSKTNHPEMLLQHVFLLSGVPVLATSATKIHVCFPTDETALTLTLACL